MSSEARTRCSSELLCAKSTFFSLLLNRTREARALCGFHSTPHSGKPVMFFVFRCHTWWPYGIGKQKSKQVFSFGVLTPTQGSGCSHFRSENKHLRLPRPKRDLETQTTYGPHIWRRGLSVLWSIRSPSLMATSVL